MRKIKLGIIGMGNMGSGHYRNILAGKCPSVEVTSVCDIDPHKLDSISKDVNVKCFTDSTELLDSGLADAVLIAVPHYDHPLSLKNALSGEYMYLRKSLPGFIQVRYVK